MKYLLSYNLVWGSNVICCLPLNHTQLRLNACSLLNEKRTEKFYVFRYSRFTNLFVVHIAGSGLVLDGYNVPGQCRNILTNHKEARSDKEEKDERRTCTSLCMSIPRAYH